MSKGNVKKFYELAKTDASIIKDLEKIDSKNQVNQSDFSELTNLIRSEIIPIAKKKGLDFTAEELLDYANEQYSQLSDEDLLAVSGGISTRSTAIGLSAVLLLSVGATTAVQLLSPKDSLNQVISSSVPADSVKSNRKTATHIDSSVYANDAVSDNLKSNKDKSNSNNNEHIVNVLAGLKDKNITLPSTETQNDQKVYINNNINGDTLKISEQSNSELTRIDEVDAAGDSAIADLSRHRISIGDQPGIVSRIVSEAECEENDIPQGFMVLAIEDGAPDSCSKLHYGDIITEINGDIMDNGATGLKEALSKSSAKKNGRFVVELGVCRISPDKSMHLFDTKVTFTEEKKDNSSQEEAAETKVEETQTEVASDTVEADSTKNEETQAEATTGTVEASSNEAESPGLLRKVWNKITGNSSENQSEETSDKQEDTISSDSITEETDSESSTEQFSSDDSSDSDSDTQEGKLSRRHKTKGGRRQNNQYRTGFAHQRRR